MLHWPLPGRNSPLSEEQLFSWRLQGGAGVVSSIIQESLERGLLLKCDGGEHFQKSSGLHRLLAPVRT
ncbi:hypothetical protein ACFSC4_22575 [Deinococcus malanensis]|uniref:hypothetical protein n=1 Tax=Deinococcus malanensis TaxID=1706855 RepID=UPI0036372EFD